MTGSDAHRTLASPRIPALAGIIALHVLVAYLLITALVQRPVVPPAPTLAAFVTADPAPQLPPARVQPGATSDQRFTLNVSLPDPYFSPPTAPEAPGLTGPFAGPAAPPAPPEEPIRLVGKHWLPSSEDYYPPDLIRLGVQGNTQVRVCVDAAGQLSGAPVVEQSSGNARLDQGALNIARAGRYARSMRGDLPVPNCYHFRIVFREK